MISSWPVLTFATDVSLHEMLLNVWAKWMLQPSTKSTWTCRTVGFWDLCLCPRSGQYAYHQAGDGVIAPRKSQWSKYFPCFPKIFLCCPSCSSWLCWFEKFRVWRYPLPSVFQRSCCLLPRTFLMMCTRPWRMVTRVFENTHEAQLFRLVLRSMGVPSSLSIVFIWSWSG